jgi:hypothetical protein
VLGVGVPVGQHNDARALGDRGVGLVGDLGQPGGQGRAAAGDLVQAGEGDRLEAGQVAVLVDVHQLGQLVVVYHRERDGDGATGGRLGVQQVALGAEVAGQRGDQLLADGVQRRVGDLGEQLGEVVEEQPGLVGERGDGRVGAHGAERLAAGLGHRGEDDPQLLLGVAEGLLTAGHRGVGVRDVLASGQRVQGDRTGVEPLLVGVLGGKRGLDLAVLDDPALCGVDQEHPAGLQPSLADHLVLRDVQDADLGGEHDQAVLGDPVAGGPQSVPVEHGADLVAVGEGDAGRAVPGLHQVGVELVEGAAGRVHGGVVLPRLRDHHQHGVRQAAPAEVEQLQHLVEGGGVGVLGGADREDPVQVAGDRVGGELRLPGRHPVAVALDGVDLAVVGDEAVRVGQRPAGEGVGGEAGVDQADRGGVAAVGQVGEERLQLPGGEHALVDQGARGQRGEVDTALAFGALAQHEGDPVQLQAGAPARAVADEQLAEARHDRAGGVAEQVRAGRHVAPAEDGEALLGGDRGDGGDRGGVGRVVVGQEGDADGVTACRGKLEAGPGAQEGVGDLGEDAGAVAGVGLRAGGAAVLQVAQDGQCLLDDAVLGLAGERRDETHAAGVVFVARVVEALRSGPPVSQGVVGAGGLVGLMSRARGRRQHRLSRRVVVFGMVTIHMRIRDDAGPLRCRAGYMMPEIPQSGFHSPSCGLGQQVRPCLRPCSAFSKHGPPRCSRAGCVVASVPERPDAETVGLHDHTV